MKIAFCADVHVGNHKILGGPHELAMNERCWQILEVLTRTVQFAKDEGCDALVVLGDLFDTERPPPQMIAAVGEAFAGLHTNVLVGNHDQVSSRKGDHALGWVHQARNMTVFERPAIAWEGGEGAIFAVPFQEGDPKEWLPAAVAHLKDELVPSSWRTRTLCIHLGLRDAKTRGAPWAAEANDAVDVEWLEGLCNAHGITHVFAGNWHFWAQWQIESTLMTQCGALVPTGWDNPGLEGYGGLVFFDTETGEVERHEIPGPRFVNVTCEAELNESISRARVGTALYVRWTCKPDGAQHAHVCLSSAREGANVYAYDVRLDNTAVKEGARKAARAVSDTSTINDALSEYIGAFEIPVGVDRQDVLARCRGFLNLSSEEIV